DFYLLYASDPTQRIFPLLKYFRIIVIVVLSTICMKNGSLDVQMYPDGTHCTTLDVGIVIRAKLSAREQRILKVCAAVVSDALDSYGFSFGTTGNGRSSTESGLGVSGSSRSACSVAQAAQAPASSPR